MSFRITEDYVQAALKLAASGYEWEPRPGDWMLDKDDHSIGMLTVPPNRPEMIRRLNVHLPTFAQVDALLDERGISHKEGLFQNTQGTAIAEFTPEEWQSDPALCKLKTLAASYP
jgi:hypothetical protein